MKTRHKKCERCGSPADHCVRFFPTEFSRPPFLAQRCVTCLSDLAGEPETIDRFEITQTYEPPGPAATA